jgi:hypothetical protein
LEVGGVYADLAIADDAIEFVGLARCNRTEKSFCPRCFVLMRKDGLAVFEIARERL